MTEKTACTFKASESPDRRLLIIIEQATPVLQKMEGGFLSLELRKGIAMPSARYLAEMLNKHIANISFAASAHD